MRARKAGFLVVAMFALLAVGAKFWETKEYTQWDERECKEMLTKSPWAFSNGFGQISQIGFRMPSPSGEPTNTGAQGAENTSTSTMGERESQIFFDFRLMSAKPIRMALARLQMLQNPQVPGLMEKIEKYVNSDPGKEILLQVSFSTKPPSDSALQDLLSYFRRASLADFQGNTYLITDKKQNVSPTSFIQASEKTPQPAFVFPRFAPDGTPYFTKDDKSITFRSEMKITTKGKSQRFDIYQKFNPKQMAFKDAFEM